MANDAAANPRQAMAVAYHGYPPCYQPMAHGGPPQPGQFPQYGGGGGAAAAAPHYGYSEIVPPSPTNHGARMDDTMSSARASDPHLPSLQDEPSENQNPSI